MADVAIRAKGIDKGLPILPASDRCNARTRSSAGYCQRGAGAGTIHRGEGRCWLHGGRGGQANRYGIAKNRINSALEERVEHFLTGDGREELHSIDVLLARMNALWVTFSQDDRETKDETLLRVVSDNSKALLRYQQLQLEGALRLDEWNELTERMRATFKQATADWLVKHAGYNRQESYVAADEIEVLARKKWESK